MGYVKIEVSGGVAEVVKADVRVFLLDLDHFENRGDLVGSIEVDDESGVISGNTDDEVFRNIEQYVRDEEIVFVRVLNGVAEENYVPSGVIVEIEDFDDYA